MESSTDSSIPPEYLAEDWENSYVRPRRGCEGHCCCYICGYRFFADWTARTRVNWSKYCVFSREERVARAEGIPLSIMPSDFQKGWWKFQRAILHNRKDSRCLLSSVYVASRRDEGLPVGEDNKTEYIFPVYRSPTNNKVPPSRSKWTAYIVHARCWELLSYHELGTVAKNDLPLLLAALRQRRQIMGSQCRTWRLEMFEEDPVRTKCVLDVLRLALEQARRSKPKNEPSRPSRPKKAQPITCRLPMEVIYMILDHTRAHTVANVEKAFGIYVTNRFWHSRASTRFFFELQDFTEDEIDWKRTCLNLERRLEKSEALRVRQYLFNCLDKTLRVVEALKDREW